MSDAPVPVRPPTSGLVLEAFLGRIFGTTDYVAMNLPRDQSAWKATGFVTWTSLSGTPGLELPTRHPVFRLDAWATTGSASGSTTPPWGKAFDLIERVRHATEFQVDQATFSTKANYGDARVLDARLVTEIVEVKGDPSGFARVQANLALDWVRVP